jgi:hypothetical protein
MRMRKQRLLITVSLAVLAACSPTGLEVLNDLVPVDDSTTAGDGYDIAVADRVVSDGGLLDLAGELQVADVIDLAEAEAGGQQCAPGEGCFLDSCTDNEQCLSGFCVEHMGDGVCTVACEEECPPGWGCEQYGAGPDLVFLCVSNHTNLCRPCAAGIDCKGTAVEDVCVDYGSEGSFCGSKCVADTDCPWGFTCQDAQTVDEVEVKQCVADAGVCPCTQKSIDLALWTSCENSSEDGVCIGKRVCTSAGLTDCDAPIPAVEVCNGIDDNCDGDIDEGDISAGTGACDDGNACTQDSCEGEVGCVHEPLTGVECIDGDSCTVGDHCEEGNCVGSEVLCDDQNPCTDDSCDGTGGCEFTVNEAFCDDGNPCTVGDVCSEGECNGTPVECDCQSDDDCTELEDGDLCNGTLACDTESWPYKCKVTLETVVLCPQPVGVDAICKLAVCEPDTGTCGFVSDHEGFACDDGDACTIGDSCLDGTCASGSSLSCADDNPCTDDACESESGCVHTNIIAACQDGDACTIGDICSGGTCQPGPAADCDDGNGCTDDACDPVSGCTHAANQAACDDGNDCTSGDHCEGGFCVSSGTAECDDKNPCTDDSCAPDGGCINTPNNSPCSDQNACTANDACQGGQCVPGDSLLCNDSNPCTDDSCNSAKGCIFESNQAACSDGNACTDGDQCANGVCTFLELLDCDDDNPCTSDTCDAQAGCVHGLNDAVCDDGDVCTIQDHCHLGQCISSGELACKDSNPCTSDSCNPLTGCEFIPNSEDCDDDNACTEGDICTAGKCQPGPSLNCDDLNPCTDDACNFATGCIHTFNDIQCDDDDACTTGEFCAAGKCGGGIVVVCDDDNVCTDDSCHPGTGCVFADNQAGCTDDDVCTDADVCAEGLCVPGPQLDCDDSNLCTDDSCDSIMGCEYVNNSIACDDNDLCTDGDVCGGGTCVPGSAITCDDGDVCTNNTCEPDQGCVYTVFTPCCGNGIPEAGEQCDDGNDVNGDGCNNDCTQYKDLVPGNIEIIAERQGFRAQCKKWSGNTCLRMYIRIPPDAVSQIADCGIDDTDSLRPVWHGQIDHQCKVVCWIATGSSACVSSSTASESGSDSGWMYGTLASNVGCDADGRQYSQVNTPTVGNILWSFDRMDWTRDGNYSSYQCNW